ncbi:hypothetical protein JHK84_051070 [Glycine max]|nr:hypothetical protein JHK84_051070 [Glycine max]
MVAAVLSSQGLLLRDENKCRVQSSEEEKLVESSHQFHDHELKEMLQKGCSNVSLFGPQGQIIGGRLLAVGTVFMIVAPFNNCRITNFHWRRTRKTILVVTETCGLHRFLVWRNSSQEAVGSAIETPLEFNGVATTFSVPVMDSTRSPRFAMRGHDGSFAWLKEASKTFLQACMCIKCTMTLAGHNRRTNETKTSPLEVGDDVSDHELLFS